jgi:hypothetical protein
MRDATPSSLAERLLQVKQHAKVRKAIGLRCTRSLLGQITFSAKELAKDQTQRLRPRDRFALIRRKCINCLRKLTGHREMLRD